MLLDGSQGRPTPAPGFRRNRRGNRDGSMTTAEDGEHWTGPRLTARFVALKGIAPEPVVHIVFRITRRADGTTVENFTVPEEPHPLDPQAAENWLVTHLGRTDRLAVAVLVIREFLD